VRLTRILLTASLSVTLAACGGEEEPAATPTLSSSPSSSPPASDAPGPSPEATAAAVDAPATAGRLTGDGIDLPGRVLVFGTPFTEALPALTSALGEPTKDTERIDPLSNYGTCPGTTLQVLEYGDGALQVLFGDVGADEPVLYQWALTGAGDPDQVPQASALVGDQATFAFGPGTTVGALEENAGEALELAEDELILDPAFRLRDRSSGFSGFLSGTTSADVVTFVEAGTPCGV
jgi:hypothetical protein